MEVHITYETLFDLLRKERSLQELQNLDKEFWKHVVDYLNERTEFMKQTSLSEQEKNKIQLQNIKRIVREIYEHRQRKIVQLAINVVHSEITSHVDTRSMLDEEKILFNKLTTILMSHRKNVLLQVMNNELPIIGAYEEGIIEKDSNKEFFGNDEKTEEAEIAETKTTETGSQSEDEQKTKSEAETSNEDFGETTNETPIETTNETTTATSDETINKNDQNKQNNEEVPNNDEQNEMSDEEEQEQKEILVKFTAPVPKFLGKDRQVFGPYDEGAIVSLPEQLANILLKKNKVIKVLDE